MPEEEKESLFDQYGGYYSVLIEEVEVARWAPSREWTHYWNDNVHRVGWSYKWVSID